MDLRVGITKKSLGIALAVMMLLSCMVIVPDEVRASTGDAISGLTLNTAPSQPLNVVADAGDRFVWLWWDHPANQGSFLIKNYTIYRSTTSVVADFVLLSTVSIGVNFYNDSASMLNDGTTFHYMITADSDAGASVYSNMASATPVASNTPPAAVGNLVATNLVYSAQLNWTSPLSAGATPIRHINVYKEMFSFMFLTAELPADAIGYLDDAVLPGETYHYSVRAISSTWGGAEATVTLFVGGTGNIPGSPENMTAYGMSDSILISWDNPANPSATGITNYTILRSTSASGPFTYIGNSSTLLYYMSIFFDNTVVLGQTYYYQVLSTNSFGPSAPSNTANAKTSNALPIPATAYPGNNQALLVWAWYFGNATSFDIYRTTVEGVRGDTPIITLASSRYYWFDNSTVNGNKYYYTVKANYVGGSSQVSNQANATPYAGSPPAAPTNLIATPDSSAVDLHATLVASNDIYIGYSIYRGLGPGAEGATPILNHSTFMLSPLYSLSTSDNTAVYDVNYYYHVTAWNMFGQSPASNEAMSFSSPEGDAPEPVTDLAATGGNGQVTLTWSNPSYQGTANLLDYNIFRYNGTAWNGISFLTTGLGQQTYVDNLLDPGTYQYRVEVTNNYGNWIGNSNTAQATTTSVSVAPSAPLSLVASAGTGYVQLSWSAPSTVGPGITNYKIFRGTTAGGEGTTVYQTVSGSTLTYNDTTVTAGQPYYYVVAAVNSVGTGPNSNEATGTPPAAAAPSAPISLTAFASVGQVQVNWSAPSSVGTGITEYRIYRGTTAGGEGTTPISTVLASILTFTDTNVVSGTPYYYTVKAVNAAGVGPASNEASATAATVPGVPSAPLGLTPVVGSNYVLLNWTAPITVGSGITNYKLYRGTTAGGEDAAPIATVAGTVLTYNDTTITSGTPYYYVVKAVNAAGTGDPSNEVSATVTNTLVPTAPKNVSTTPGTGQIVVAWVAPDSNGASPISGYQIYRSVNGSQMVLIGNASATATSFTDTNVDVSHTYGYTVVATNSNGSSPMTNQVTSTPTLNKSNASDDNTMLFLGIGLAAIIGVVGLAALMLFRRKK
jgi:fibronectin type 3 domain-containing protein